MTTVKDLFENDEFIDEIVDDLENIHEDTPVTYEVWALGYTRDGECTDDEVLVGEFTDPDVAVRFAENVSYDLIKEFREGEADPATTYFSIEVETVVADPDDEDGGTINIDTIHSRDLWLEDAEVEEEDDSADSVVSITERDFEFLEDGTMKISCTLLKDFNKNDLVTFEFPEESPVAYLTYKIMSKVIYADGDYYHCELMI